jgi:thioredoxin-dependent peroxiredoxin
LTDTDTSIREGDFSPDFSFNDNHGKRIKLSNLRGKKVVVYFYPKDFTPGCSTEAAEFVGDYKSFEAKNIDIIGISPDDRDSHLRFKEKMKISYYLVPDTDFTISKMYGVYGLKTFMGKDYMGVIRTTFLVDENGIVYKVFNKVKPLGHSQEVLHEFEKDSLDAIKRTIKKS